MNDTSAMRNWQHVRSGLLGLIMITTLVLNSLLVMVLRKMKSRRSKQESASYNIEKSYMYLLFHLAFADMLGVIVNIPFSLLDHAGVEYLNSPIGCTLLWPFQLASTSAQAGTYVALSYHRFRAIVYPIRANLTVCKSVLMICVIWSFGVCLSLPFFIVLRLTDKGCKEVWPQGVLSSNIYTFTIFIVQYAAPVCLMVFFYVSIAKTLQEHRTAKEIIHAHTREDVRSHRHIVRMLVTIVTVYSVCMLPHHLLWIIHGLRPMEEKDFEMITRISYLFTYSNTVANPAIFFVYNKESRYYLRRFFWNFYCCARHLRVPFDIDVKLYSATSSGHSRSDSANRNDKRTSKADQLKLQQFFLNKPGDSDLGVSLPWEAQVLNSHASTDECHECNECDPSLSSAYPAQNPFLCVPNPTIHPIDTSIPNASFLSPVEINSSTELAKEAKNTAEDPEGGEPSAANVVDQKVDENEGGLSEDETGRVQNVIKEMMGDVRNEMKKYALKNGHHCINSFDNLFLCNDTSPNDECETGEERESDNGMVSCLETDKPKFSSSPDLLKEIINLLENSPNGTKMDIDALKEHLRNLPETRM